jgi:nitrate reductase delta subunit
MSRSPSLLLRALSALLGYPDAELRAGLPEIAEAIRTSRAIKRRQKNDLMALVDEIAGSDAFEAEGRYVDLFDRGRRTSLNLFEHVHGDGRARGPAMLELRQRYLDAGMEPVSGDLPDSLPVLLEYLSCQSQAEVRSTIGEAAIVLRKLGNTLLKRRSRYAAVIAAILAIGGETGLDQHASVPPADDFDRTWEEKPAFAPPEPDPAVLPEHRVA